MQLCKRLSLISVIALPIALIACHSNSDPRAEPSGGARAVMNGGTPSSESSAGGTSEDQGDDAPNEHQEDEGSNDSEPSGDDWPARRKVPGGTLTWTVVYMANATLGSHDDTEVVTLHRTLHGRARMQGGPGSPDARAPDNSYTQADRAMRACGDNAACQQAEAAKLMARVTGDPQGFRHDLQSTQLALQRDTSWGTVSCTADVEADDHASWSGISSDGYIRNAPGKRSGKQTVEPCDIAHHLPQIVADDASKTYQLALPGMKMEATRTIHGTASGGADVRLPGLLIKGIRYDSLNRPLSGSVRMQIGADYSIWKEQELPLTEQVDWTFTPDAK